MPKKRETPAELLAKIIAERMKKEKLIEPGRASKLSASLASGKMKENDWRLELEYLAADNKKPPKK